MGREIAIPFILKESDLRGLGECTWGNDDTGGTNFICDPHNRVEMMFIRTIVEALGFEVTSEEELGCDNGRVDVMLETTYPWERYEKL